MTYDIWSERAWVRIPLSSFFLNFKISGSMHLVLIPGTWGTPYHAVESDRFLILFPMCRFNFEATRMLCVHMPSP